MFCKKCGTEQRNGHTFCPKCGEPFLSMSKIEYLRKGRVGILDEQETDTSKEEDAVNQMEKIYIESHQPQPEDKIIPKEVGWEEKKDENVNFMTEFFSNTDKLRKATIGVSIIAVLWFFIFNNGFSASWTWWLFAIAFVVLAFYKVEARDDEDALKKARLTFGLSVFLGFVLLYNSPSGGSFGDLSDDSSIDYNAKNDNDMRILSEMASVYGEIKNTLPQVEQLYDAHREHMAEGLPQTTSPAWGRWQDLYHRINGLWDKYISLARQLDDSDDLVEEAQQKKSKMNKAFEEMFVPQY